jgi:hypothetical protein
MLVHLLRPSVPAMHDCARRYRRFVISRTDQFYACPLLLDELRLHLFDPLRWPPLGRCLRRQSQPIAPKCRMMNCPEG